MQAQAAPSLAGIEHHRVAAVLIEQGLGKVRPGALQASVGGDQAQNHVVILQVGRPGQEQGAVGKLLDEGAVGAVTKAVLILVYERLGGCLGEGRIGGGKKHPRLSNDGGEILAQSGGADLADVGLLLGNVIVGPIVGVEEVGDAVLNGKAAVDAALVLRGDLLARQGNEGAQGAVRLQNEGSQAFVIRGEGGEHIEPALIFMHLRRPVGAFIQAVFLRVEAGDRIAPAAQIRRYVNVKAAGHYAVVVCPRSVHIICVVFQENKGVANVDVLSFHRVPPVRSMIGLRTV